MTKKSDIELLQEDIEFAETDMASSVHLHLSLAKRLLKKLDCSRDHYDEAVRDMTCDRFCDEWEGTNEVF